MNEDDLLAKIWLSLSYFEVGNLEKAHIHIDSLKEHVFVLEAKQGRYMGGRQMSRMDFDSITENETFCDFLITTNSQLTVKRIIWLKI